MDHLYQRLIDHFGGAQIAAAQALGVEPQVISNWKHRGIPKARALDVEDVTKGRITAREVLAAQRETRQ